MKKILLSLIVCLAFVCFSCPQMAEASDEGTATSQVDTSSQVGKKHPNVRENRANASHKKMKGKKKTIEKRLEGKEKAIERRQEGKEKAIQRRLEGKEKAMQKHDADGKKLKHRKHKKSNKDSGDANS